METLNGYNQEVVVGSAREASLGSRNSYCRALRFCITLVCLLSIGGCSFPKIKSSLMTGIATTTAVGVTSVVAPGVLVPAVVGGTTAAIASALSAERSVKGEPVVVTADTVIQEAPANFFSLLEQLIEIGGWLLILVILVPMFLGWALPGPTEIKKKRP